MQENQLDDAIRTGYAFLDEVGSSTRKYTVLKKVFDYAGDQVSNNETVVFTWKDIAELNELESGGKALKNHISDAIKELNEQISKLNKLALENGYDSLPKLQKIEKGGGAGIANKYQLSAISVDLEPLDIEIPAGHIRYKLEKISKPNIFARVVNNYSVEGIKFAVLAGWFASLLILGLLILLFGFYSIMQTTTVLGLLKIVFGFGAFIYSLYLFISPLYRCLSLRIISSPILFTPSDIRTAQLEYVPTTRTTDKGRLIRKFRIVTYTATCPVCDGRIDLEEGKGAMKNRLVGCCSESPREHVFSFDHQTKSGKACFSEYENWNV